MGLEHLLEGFGEAGHIREANGKLLLCLVLGVIRSLFHFLALRDLKRPLVVPVRSESTLNVADLFHLIVWVGADRFGSPE